MIHEKYFFHQKIVLIHTEKLWKDLNKVIMSITIKEIRLNGGKKPISNRF